MNKSNTLPNLIVFSHLRWEFVKQRPQHIISRLAEDNRILFVEEPIGYDEQNFGTANIIEVNPNIVVLQPRIEWGNFKNLKRVIDRYSHLTSKKPIVWFYSASFLPILTYIDYSLTVYDCMDELTAFKGAPKELMSNEKDLLLMADIVFAGGRSLFESKRKHAKNAYLFPSSVDKKHFAKANSYNKELSSDISHLKKTIAGFYGVIDERIDLSLLDELAKKCPHVDFVMIGPVVKIDEKDLPRAENIHYLGMKSYDALPGYLSAFKIAIMPFAINESTQFISPTKTLEFMAAHKPIISTSIADVKKDYGKEVAIVNSSQEFVNAIERYLSETKEERAKRMRLQKKAVEKTSWDNTAVSMKNIMSEVLDVRESRFVNPSLYRQLQVIELLAPDTKYV